MHHRRSFLLLLTAARNGMRVVVMTEARRRWSLNPGDGPVSRLTHGPHVSVAMLGSFLARYGSGGQLTVLYDTVPVRADVSGDRVRLVTVRHKSGVEKTLSAPYFVDATEQGDLLPLAGVEFVTGFESRTETLEPHAPLVAQPSNIQALTVCFAADYVAGGIIRLRSPPCMCFGGTMYRR